MGPRVELHIHLAPGPLPIRGNATQLRQAMLNLCTNARDAMNEAGAVTLTTSRRTVDSQTADREGAASGEYGVLSVIDTGSGMTPRTMSRMFEPFFTTKDPQHGTGLGLMVVNNIVKQHEGFITVRSEVGKGSQFDVYLPLRAAAAPAAPAPP
jgi:two-component system, cell cycle sensor histidine kinase and response regulator CckA